MITLKSKKLLIFQARENKTGIITMKLFSSTHNVPDNSFSVNIQDIVTLPAGDGYPERDEVISSNYMAFTPSEIEEAEEAVGVISNVSLSELTEAVLLTALKKKIDELKLYGAVSSDFEIVVNPEI